MNDDNAQHGNTVCERVSLVPAHHRLVVLNVELS